MKEISRLDKLVRLQEGITTLTRTEIKEIQLKKLNALLRRFKKSGRAFYAHIPESLNSVDELCRLPFTTPAELRERGEELLLAPQSHIEKVVTDRTSGTTGSPKRLYYTQTDCDRTVAFFTAGLSELVYPGDPVMICMPFSGGRALGSLISEAIENLGARPISAGIGLTFGELHKIIEEEQPKGFVGMPIPFLSMLRMYGRCSLERAVVSGDASPVSVAAATEKLLGSELFPHYGLRETCMGGAVTCSAHCGMHLRENDIIAEIVDENGNVLPEGALGELVLTTVALDAMPVLRYRTGDTARLVYEQCPCGSSLVRIKDVSRINNDMYRMDERLFALDFMIDYSVEGKQVTALTKGGIGAGEIKKAAPELFSDAGYELVVRAASDKDAPQYYGKRFMERLFQKP